MKKTQTSGFTGHTLKLIALITMFIDHIGAILLEYGLLPSISDAVLAGNSFDYLPADYQFWSIFNLILRLIGRLAFPLYCFLLVEGFLHTKSITKYAFRLGVFALLSEIPFDLAVSNTYFNIEMQNVFFTLLIGLLVLWGMKAFEKLPFPMTLLRYLVALVGMRLADFIHSDYTAYGILLIVLLYELRSNKKWKCISGAVLTFFQSITGALAFIFIGFYNGERGKQLPKYFFYAFYPAHLLLLFLVRMLLLS